MNTPKTPKVSACIVTYNQANYIRQCLQSIVDQNPGFDFEVIVGDDASTDGTTEIIREFVERFPGLVTAILHETNVGPTQNSLSVHNMAVGEYVCHCDGDDYWLPGKLSAMAKHMDANEDCNIAWHRMLILNDKGQSTVGMPLYPVWEIAKKSKFYANDLAKYYGLTGCHSASVYRRSKKSIYARTDNILDYFRTLSYVTNGGCAMYVDAVYGVYRYFASDITLTKTKGDLWVGNTKHSLIKEYLQSNPELARSFAAQCFFEVFIRTYFRRPLKKEFFLLMLACRKVPSVFDIILIFRVFLANRNAKLQEALSKSGCANNALIQ